MSTLLCVVGSKTTNETKIKVALITPTNVGEKPQTVLFTECVVPTDVNATAKKLLTKAQTDHPGAVVELTNGLYVSQSTGQLTSTDHVSEDKYGIFENVLNPVLQTETA